MSKLSRDSALGVLRDWVALAERAIEQYGVEPHSEERAILERARALTTAAPAVNEVERLRGLLRDLVTNPHVDLGDLVYDVREREGAGWEGPWVKHWSDTVTAIKKELGL
jgi:hypothetical protein